MLSHFLRTIAADDDPNFRNVTLLLPGNGTNGAQNNTFLDSSTNNFTITRNGNTTQGTFSPYGDYWSNYFDGTGDYLSWSGSTVGTNQYTFECWFFCTGNFSSNQTLLGTLAATNGRLSVRINSATVIAVDRYGIAQDTYTIPTLVANQWYHLAVVRGASNATTVFLNGVRSSTGTVTDSYNYGLSASIGYLNPSFPLHFTGYISNARLVIGSAVYDPTQTTITVPAQPLTAVANTSLLTCQSNRLIDNSANNFTITRNGDVSVQKFSPFNPTAAYDPAVVGASGYFDGTGDFLDCGSNSAFAFGTGDFTVEAWVIPTGGFGALNRAIVANSDAASANNWQLNFGSANTIQFFYKGASTSTDLISSTSAFGSTGGWIHVLVSGSAGVIRLFVNGMLEASVTYSWNYTSTGLRSGINRGANAFYTGYISSLRLLKGTALYTTNFTPPTTPLTAITNTSLLLNFTNAGIIDNAMMNDLETVGNAQISTAQSVFGGSSMLFDGTGDVVAVSYTTAAAMNLLKPWGSGSYTLECWLRFTSVASGQHIFLGYTNATGTFDFAIYTASTGSLNYYLSSNGTTWNLANGVSVGSIATNQWYHFAFVKNGNTWTPYLNGVAGTPTTTATTIIQNALPFSIGGLIGGGAGTAMNGYIDDLRVTRGIARYTADFTPPVRPFPTR